MARTDQNPLAGQLSLGVIPTVGPYLLPKVVGQISADLPELGLRLVEEQTAVLMDKLQAGELDCALLALPVELSSLKTLGLYTEEFLFATSNRGQAVSEKALDKLPVDSLILLSEGHCFRDQALEVCDASGAGENAMYRATSLETLRSMVALGRGDTLLPALAALKDDGLQLAPFSQPAPKREIGMVYRRSSVREEAILALGATIRTALDKAYLGCHVLKYVDVF